MTEFYLKTLQQLIAGGFVDPSGSTLVVAGGPKDRDVLLAAGFTDVTISNLDDRMTGAEFAPCRWAFIDGENIAFPDEGFDNVFVHMGLHHCGSPHRALTEMYRVARKSVLALENRDSAAMKLAVRLGLVPQFEYDAVRGNDFKWGGWRNTAVPNFVYRWTETEVAKTVACIDPAFANRIRYFYNLRYPEHRIENATGLKRIALRLLKAPFGLLAWIFPKQSNEFGFFIDKRDRRLQPWIDPATGVMATGLQTNSWLG
jgi:ubiquinone/menaquinone biosynthesis C-methylase UbiE